jgi:hypothetical protein
LCLLFWCLYTVAFSWCSCASGSLFVQLSECMPCSIRSSFSGRHAKPSRYRDFPKQLHVIPAPALHESSRSSCSTIALHHPVALQRCETLPACFPK